MILKHIDQIGNSDIEALIENAVPEGRQIEYKRTLPGKLERDRKEFLSDVSSLANCAGGDLIYGIEEKRDAKAAATSIPGKATGLDTSNVNQEILGLESSLQASISPRIPGIKFKVLQGFSKGPILLLRIPRSLIGLHMVTYGGTSKFYTRNSKGKYEMDVNEIRGAFAFSEALPETIRSFREKRIEKIAAGDSPVILHALPKSVLHFVPFASFDQQLQLDVSEFGNLGGILRPVNSSGWNSRHNLDGFLTYSKPEGSSARAYLQLFRNGIIEAVEADILGRSGDKKLIPGGYEGMIIEQSNRCLLIAKDLGLEPPYIIFLSFLNVNGFAVYSGFWSEEAARDGHIIDRNMLLLPEVLVENNPGDLTFILKPLFDALWQSAGWDNCKRYAGDTFRPS